MLIITTCYLKSNAKYIYHKHIRNIYYLLVIMEERINEKIKQLCIYHKDDEYVLNRLENYICNILPIALKKSKIDNEKRTKRREQLSTEADAFTERFLNKGNYYNLLKLEGFWVNLSLVP